MNPFPITLGPYDAKGFWLVCGDLVAVRCTYIPTFGYEGFGRKKRRVKYPCGSIVIDGIPGVFGSLNSCFDALTVAKSKLQAKLGA